MIDSAAQSRLRDLFRRENRTLLQYARESSPWAADKDQHRVDRVRELAEAEFAGLEELARFLEKQHVTLPYLGAYPMLFTNYNFMDIAKLMPMIRADQRRTVAAIESDLST